VTGSAETLLEAPPTDAAAVFGPNLPRAVAYAELLATVAIERGLLGPREAGRLWTRHLLNATALVDLIPTGATVFDLGSGAGLPGIPLALARPDLCMTLVEPMARRADFLHECAEILGLDVAVVRARAEDASGAPDIVTARALAPLTKLLTMTEPLLGHGGTLLALKGRAAHTEVISAAPTMARLGVVSDVHAIMTGHEQTFVVEVTFPAGGANPRRVEE
jgi:16S rRNA (guanine527-N7)-methyltransferase